MDEFKKFILRGNVIDLAVGVIIGGAFNKIITSLVNDVIMPLLSIIIGQISFDSRFIALDGERYASLEAAGSAPILKYGSFLSTVLDFLIMGIVIFFMMKGINLLHEAFKKDKDSPAPAVTTKACPYCISQIHIDATVCPQCTSALATGEADTQSTPATGGADSHTDASVPPA